MLQQQLFWGLEADIVEKFCVMIIDKKDGRLLVDVS